MNKPEREGRKACRSRGLLAGMVVDSMKARPAGEGVQSVVGRNGRFSGCDELRFLLYIVRRQLAEALYIVF